MGDVQSPTGSLLHKAARMMKIEEDLRKPSNLRSIPCYTGYHHSVRRLGMNHSLYFAVKCGKDHDQAFVRYAVLIC